MTGPEVVMCHKAFQTKSLKICSEENGEIWVILQAVERNYVASRWMSRIVIKHPKGSLDAKLCFAGIATSYVFSCAWQRARVFPRFAPAACLAKVACFPELTKGFAHVATVADFPSLGNGCMVSSTWHQLHVLLSRSDGLILDSLRLPGVPVFLLRETSENADALLNWPAKLT